MRVPGIVIALAAVVAGCRPDCTPPAGETRPNVVLVTVDTLRADHLGCYGSPAVRTPHFDRLAAEGALFERCYSQSHVTLPSHLSLLSSMPLADHGLTSNGASLARPVTVLPQLFAAAGYRTAAFVGIRNLGPEGPLGPLLKGLDVYHAPSGALPLRAEETNAAAFHWLRGRCGKPFFAWIHYWDPHMPYEPPSPFDSAYYQGDPYDARATSMEPVTLNWFFHQTEGLRGRLATRAGTVRSLKRELGLNSRRLRRLLVEREGMLEQEESFDPALRRRIDALSLAIRRELPYKAHLADWLKGVRDLNYPLGRYAGEVAYVDQEVGRLQRELVELGLGRRTILVVTADHGESLGDHGVYFDHFGLHEPDVRVPLIVWAPDRVTPARHAEIARGLDVAPTVLRLAGLAVPAAMQGRDLFAQPPPDDVVSEAARGLQLMVVQGRWKLIRTLKSHYYVEAVYLKAGNLELYDVEADPREQDNQAARRPDLVRELDGRLTQWSAGHDGAGRPEPPAALSPERQRELRALGYIE